MSENIPDDIRKTALDITLPYETWLTLEERAGLVQAIAISLFSERRRHHEQEEASSEFERLLSK